MAVIEYAGAEWHIARQTIAAARARTIPRTEPIDPGPIGAPVSSNSNSWTMAHAITAVGIFVAVAAAIIAGTHYWYANNEGARREKIEKVEACNEIDDPVAAATCVVAVG